MERAWRDRAIRVPLRQGYGRSPSRRFAGEVGAIGEHLGSTSPRLGPGRGAVAGVDVRADVAEVPEHGGAVEGDDDAIELRSQLRHLRGGTLAKDWGRGTNASGDGESLYVAHGLLAGWAFGISAPTRSRYDPAGRTGLQVDVPFGAAVAA